MSASTDAVEALRAGHVVGVPTDTVYGLAADPFQEQALGRLYALKGRPADRPVSLLVASVEQAGALGEMGPRARELAARHWPGGLTLVVPRAPDLPDWLGDPDRGTIGVRMPHHPVALGLLAAAGPLAVSSANPSGQPPLLSAERVREVFGEGVAVYLKGEAPGGKASTVVDVTSDPPRVLRPGPVEL